MVWATGSLKLSLTKYNYSRLTFRKESKEKANSARNEKHTKTIRLYSGGGACTLKGLFMILHKLQKIESL